MRSKWWMVGLLVICCGSLPAMAGGAGAMEWRSFAEIKASAEKDDPEAQLALGDAYLHGAGVEASPRKAARWHRKAAEKGLATAQYRLGLDYLRGEGVKQDSLEGLRWISKAADQGMTEARIALARCHARGIGVKQNTAEAVRIYRKLAEQGIAEAEFELGRSYLEGEGVAVNIEQGVQWIRKAAGQGFAPAQHRFGLCHVKGEGVTRDPVQAYKWLSLAAAQDDERALDIKVDLAKLNSTLTQEQIAQAQKLAAEFKPRQADVPEMIPSPAPTSDASASSPNPRFGYVRIQAEDEAHEVYIDGSFVGNTPAKVKLSEGTHRVEVKKPGHRDYRKEIQVGEAAELNLKAVLEKQ